MKEQIKKVLNGDVKEMYTLLKNRTNKELSFFIDSSLLSNYEIYLKYCMNNNFTLDDVKKDYDIICEYIKDEIEYNEIYELFEENYRENIDDSGHLEYDDNSLVYYYQNLERNKYKEDALKDSGYLELTFEDLDY